MAVSYSKGFIAAGYDNVVCLHRETGKLVKSFHEHEKRYSLYKNDRFHFMNSYGRTFN